MLRFAWVIVLMAAIAAGVVWLRLEQNRVQAEMCRMEAQRMRVRRTLWEQQVRISQLSAPDELRRRGQAWALGLVEPGQLSAQERGTLARRGSPSSPIVRRN